MAKHADSHAQRTQIHTLIQCTYAHKHSHIQLQTHTRTTSRHHSDTCYYTCTCPYTQERTATHTHTHTNTRRHTHKPTQTHTHTHTHTNKQTPKHRVPTMSLAPLHLWYDLHVEARGPGPGLFWEGACRGEGAPWGASALAPGPPAQPVLLQTDGRQAVGAVGRAQAPQGRAGARWAVEAPAVQRFAGWGAGSPDERQPKSGYITGVQVLLWRAGFRGARWVELGAVGWRVGGVGAAFVLLLVWLILHILVITLFTLLILEHPVKDVCVCVVVQIHQEGSECNVKRIL